MSQPPYSSSTAPNSPGQSTTGAAGDAVGQAQDTISQVGQQAQTTASQVTEQAKQQATSQLESQKARAVDSLVTVAQALRQTGQQLNQQDQATVGGYVEQVAQRVEGATNYLRARDIPQLVADTQDFARRQPVLFLTGAVALGFIGARFLMSSGQRSRQSSATSGNPPYGYGYGYSAAGGYPPASGVGYPAGAATASGSVPGYAAGSAALPRSANYGSSSVRANSGDVPAVDEPEITNTNRAGSGNIPGSLEA